MILYHATLRSNLPSILKGGIDPSFSQGKQPLVWLCSERLQPWATIHTVRRHGGKVQDVVLLKVRVPRHWLRRTNTRGLWNTPAKIRPGRVLEVIGFETVSRSPLESL